MGHFGIGVIGVGGNSHEFQRTLESMDIEYNRRIGDGKLIAEKYDILASIIVIKW